MQKTLCRYKGILFDFDGTLVEMAIDWISIRRKLAKLFDSFNKKASFKLLLKDIRDTYKELRLRDGEPEKAESFLREAFETIKRGEIAGIKEARAAPGAREIIDWLNEHEIQIAIVSNNDGGCVRLALEKCNLPVPQVIVGRDMVSADKPALDGAFLAINRLKLNKDECCIVGNSDVDLEIGNRLGIQTFFLSQEEHESGSSNVFFIRNLLDIKEYIEVNSKDIR